MIYGRKLYDIRQIRRFQEEYPKQLLKLSQAPDRLYFRGNIEMINQCKNVAVIGSRQISDKGIAFAWHVGYELGKRGMNVVNGLALGCDTYAFKGALSAGGRCTAVMPCGLGQIVPRSNIELAEELLSKGGCLISEYPAALPIHKYQYIQRDRLQSGISDGVIIIEAGYESGTMHTAKYAVKQGKKLACIDSRVITYSSGNRWLEEQNGVKVIRDMEDLDCFIDELSYGTEQRQMTLAELLKTQG